MDYLGTYPAIHLMFAITQVVQKATSSWNILLFLDPWLGSPNFGIMLQCIIIV